MSVTERERQLLQNFISLSFGKITKPYEDNSQCALGSRGFYALYALAAYGPMTMTNFGLKANMKKQQTTKIVDKLVELNFAERLYDKNDRRAIWIRITPTGQGFLDNNNVRSVDNLLSLMSELDKKDVKSFYSSLEVVNSFLEKLPRFPVNNNKEAKNKKSKK